MTLAASIARYRARSEDAVARNLHHDQRRSYLLELLREGFGIQAEEVTLEQNVHLDSVRGRIDVLFRQVVFEVKRDLAKERDDVQRELRLYLDSIGERAFGIATDGPRFEAYQLAVDGLRLVDAMELKDTSDDDAASWLDSYLFSQFNVTPTAEDIVRRFGPNSSVFAAARDQLDQLWTSLEGEPTVSIKREEWDRLLRMVYGSPKGSDDLFLRHTYLALVARLLAYLAIARRLPVAGTELEVVTGEAFGKLGIDNLVEDDFFAWVGSERIRSQTVALVAGLVRHLGVYATDEINEDLLKQLYETLVDPADRHDLGEYYTPDWLAELLLEEADYGPGVRILDPSCGSGTFLFTAIRRLRSLGLSGIELVEEAEKNIAGFDVHPLAVTVARANFVLALRQDALEARHRLSIPIWMADSLAVPEASFGRPIEVEVTRRGGGERRERFVLPTEMEDVRPGLLRDAVAQLGEFADPALPELEAAEGLAVALDRIGGREFVEIWQSNLKLLRTLKDERRDSVWTFILSNAVRPQVIARARVDLIVGNPPWLALRDIAEARYRDRLTNLALEYGLLQARRGWRTGALELATVFACFAADHYLRPEGKLAFVLPRGVLFGAKQHEPFRKLALSVPLAPMKGFDLQGVDSLFNVPSCAVLMKRERVEGLGWEVAPITGKLPRRDANRAERIASLTIGPERALGGSPLRASPYLARATQGATIAPRPFWFVVPATPIEAPRLWVRTDHEASARAKPPWTGLTFDGEVERDYLYATALTIFPFRLGPIKLCVLPVDIAQEGVRILDAGAVLKRGAPGLHRWLTKVEATWQARKKDSAAQNVHAEEYLDNHANLTRQRLGGIRLAYGADGTYVRAAVVDTDQIALEARARGFVFDMNTYWIRVESKREAHYLAAVLNTPFVNDAIKEGQTQGAFGARHIHRRPFESVPIPEFDVHDARHLRLAELSATAHERLEGTPIVRTQARQLESVRDEVAEAASLARAICDVS